MLIDVPWQGDLAGSKQAAGVQEKFGDVSGSIGDLKKGFWGGNAYGNGLRQAKREPRWFGEMDTKDFAREQDHEKMHSVNESEKSE